jgi:hypothetical protein
MTVVGNGNIDVGNKTPTRKPIDGPNPVKTERLRISGARISGARISGAMSQQCGDSGRGNESAPQKFLQLVGYRNPKARPEPWIRPSPPAKR